MLKPLSLLFALVALIVASHYPVVFSHAAQRHVLVVSSYHPEMPWVAEYSSEIVEGLEGKAEVSFLYLDSKRLDTKQSEAKAKQAFDTYVREKPDVVVLGDDFAVDHLGQKIASAGTPVVFLGVNNNPRAYFDDMMMATGVLERPLLKRSLLFIIDLIGKKTEKCLILFDDSKTANLIVNAFFGKERNVMLSGVKTQIKLVNDFEQWKRLVREAPEKEFDILMVGLHHTLRDENAEHVNDDRVIRWTSSQSELPIFGVWDFSIGNGKAIGGLVNSAIPQGREAVKLITKILNGASPNQLPPVTAEEGRFVFSRHELHRWGFEIPESFYDVHSNLRTVD